MKPIHIHLKDEDMDPVAEKLRPLALNIMELLRKYLNELLCGYVIEGPLTSELLWSEYQTW